MPGAQQVRPRYLRMGAAGLAFVVTVVTLLGGIGLVPGDSPAAADTARSGDQAALTAMTIPDATRAPTPTPAESPTGTPTEAPTGAVTQIPTGVPTHVPVPSPTTAPTTQDSRALPGNSGTGRRIVFDMSDQRVWLVGDNDDVRRTYLVSGSVTDNLTSGTYAVYSRSRHAVGINDSGVMEYFTRFTRGANAAIGFHSIPTKDGRALQTREQLGTPQSHGCIRQALPDAKALWAFAPAGTKVVVRD